MKVSRTKSLVIVISILLIIGLVAIVYAQPMFRGQGQQKGLNLLQNPKVKEKLQLTDDQINKIKEVTQDTQKKMIDLNAKDEIANIELQSLLDSPSIDKKAVEAKVDELGKIRTEIHKTDINRRIAMKEILTPEQQQKIKDFIGNRIGQRIKERQEGKGQPGLMRGNMFRRQQQGMGGMGKMGRMGNMGMCPMMSPENCPGFPGMGQAPKAPEGPQMPSAPQSPQAPSAPKTPRGKAKNSGAFENNPDINFAPDKVASIPQNTEEAFESENISADDINVDEPLIDSEEDIDDLALLFN